MNLQWAVKIMFDLLSNTKKENRLDEAFKKAKTILKEDINSNFRIGKNGYEVVKKISRNYRVAKIFLNLMEFLQACVMKQLIIKSVNEKSNSLNVLTHCNAGWLATLLLQYIMPKKRV